MLVRNLTFEYVKGKPVLEKIGFEIEPGMNALIGPNASGKSTVLKCLAGVLKTKNCIFYEGCEINAYKSLYSSLSYLPQQIAVGAALSVFEVMLLGIVDKLSWRVDEKNLKLAQAALDDFEIADIASKKINEISGGQQQEVFIAQALMKKPRYLLIDEPTNNLDLKNQLKVMEKIKNYAETGNVRTLVVLHDLNLALRYADCVYVMKNGRIVAQGNPEKTISAVMLEKVYEVRAEIIKTGSGISSVALR
jgi:iron complex transport system ATP-binding protein